MIKEELKIFSGSKELVSPNKKFKVDAVVGVVLNGNKILLGTATNDDDRFGKLCFLGGGVDTEENPKDAVIREVKEESGIDCKIIKELPFNSKPGVKFYLCKATSNEIKHNNEFSSMGWYNLNKINKEEVYFNNKEILEYIEQGNLNTMTEQIIKDTQTYIHPTIESDSYVLLLLAIGTLKRNEPLLNTLGNLDKEQEERMLKVGEKAISGKITGDKYVDELYQAIKKLIKKDKIEMEDYVREQIKMRIPRKYSDLK